MAVSKAYGVGGIDIGGTALGGIINTDKPTGTVTEEIATDGNVYARFQSMLTQDPIPTFTTHAVAAALALCGVTGLKIDDLTGGFSLYAQQRAQGGTRESGSSHIKYNVTDGILVPTTLSVSQDGSATLSYSATARSDSGAAPMIITDSQALPSTTDDERFGIGPVDIGGTTITGVTGIDIDFGLTVRGTHGDGDVYPSFVSIDLIQPSITFRVLDASVAVSSVPLAGVLGTHADTIFYLRKRALGGQYVSDATAEHVKFTAYGMAIDEDLFNASANDLGELTIRMTPIDDGSTASPLTATESAIT